ncbi:hypothetical protein BJY00DRAFT_116701 [Aspergillus carlsbadensis]|nr:hypothetical protein BJY00DRAFT_116701 [Aspergillus carlsbadensis]
MPRREDRPDHHRQFEAWAQSRAMLTGHPCLIDDWPAGLRPTCATILMKFSALLTFLGPTCAACVAIGQRSWECVQESASGTEVWLSNNNNIDGCRLHGPSSSFTKWSSSDRMENCQTGTKSRDRKCLNLIADPVWTCSNSALVGSWGRRCPVPGLVAGYPCLLTVDWLSWPGKVRFHIYATSVCGLCAAVSDMESFNFQGSLS